MKLLRRLVLGLLIALGSVRAVAYLIYAVLVLPSPLETFHLEAKMVLLAYRVQAGLPLYPAWRDYPHVANFFGPVYFLLVGRVGRLIRADLPQLFPEPPRGCRPGRGAIWRVWAVVSTPRREIQERAGLLIANCCIV